jgi:hypothetical protein
MIEAKKLAYSDYVQVRRGPAPYYRAFKATDLRELADERSKLIDMNKAACQVVPSEGEAELDKHRN